MLTQNIYHNNTCYYNLDHASRFWHQYLQPQSEDEYVEIRLTAITDVEYVERGEHKVLPKRLVYDMVERYVEEQRAQGFEVIVRKNCQFFIRTWCEFELLLTWKNGWFSYFTKMCYGVNNRYKDSEGSLTGGYKSVRRAKGLFVDIEDSEHGLVQNGSALKGVLHNYINTIKHYIIGKYGLHNFFIISSGSGYHFLSRFEPLSITDNVKIRYKQFILDLHERFNNDWFEVDKLYDLTRIVGLPGSYNRKRQAFVELLEDEQGVPGDYEKLLDTVKLPKNKKRMVNNSVPVVKNIEDSLEWTVLVNEAPQGERHNILLFALKLLLKANGVKNVSRYEQRLQDIYGGNIDLDPEKGTENKDYNKGIILNWCKRHMKWILQNNNIYKKYCSYLTSQPELVDDGSLKENEKVFE